MHAAAEAVFWACWILLGYAYVGYPLLLLAIAQCFPRPAIFDPSDEELPSVSLIIAARNEVASIGGKLAQTVACDYPAEKLEIVIASDASEDGTDEVVRRFAEELAAKSPHPRVRLLRTPDRRGKTHAQNQAAAAASGEILVFSDATTVYDPRALRWLVANYRDPKVGAVTGRLTFFDPLKGRPEKASPTGAGSVVFWNYENLIKQLQWRIRTLTGCSGCIYSTRACSFEPLPVPGSSDFLAPLYAVRRGWRVAFEPRAAVFEETTETAAQEFRMRIRVITGGMLGMRRVRDLLRPWCWPWISFQLVSHKISRWAVGWLLLAIFMANLLLASRPFYAWALAAQLVFYGLALATLRWPLQRHWRVLGVPLYFCLVNVAAMVACVEILRGRDHATWTPIRRLGPNS